MAIRALNPRVARIYALLPPAPAAREAGAPSPAQAGDLPSAPRAGLTSAGASAVACQWGGQSGTCLAGPCALQAPAPLEHCLGQTLALHVEARAPGSGSAPALEGPGLAARMPSASRNEILNATPASITQGLRGHYARVTQAIRKDWALDYAVITQQLRRCYALDYA